MRAMAEFVGGLASIASERLGMRSIERHDSESSLAIT